MFMKSHSVIIRVFQYFAVFKGIKLLNITNKMGYIDQLDEYFALF